ncbi:MAG TPA: outer membrane beta-barrel protein [Gammaproteobacteria bacterium]|nr:outer membrane beta-barrel protein [Gammaproteobacteria bacterium]
MAYKSGALILASLVLALGASPAPAQGLYFGAGLGAARAADADSNVQRLEDRQCAVLLGSGATSCAWSESHDTTNPAYSVFAGYGFSRYLAVELGYAGFGTYKLHASVAAAGAGATSPVYYEQDNASAAYADAVLSYPVIERIAVFARAGIGYVQNRKSCTDSVSGCSPGTDNEWKPTYGVGVSVNVAPETDVRMAYTEFDGVGDNNRQYTAGKFRMLEIDGVYHFE